ncbi:MAG: HU family DNA-binding protein [Thermodesulfobacteriota bacterium]
MTKSEISRKISYKFRLSVSEAEKVLGAIVEGMSSAVSSGSRVEIRGFGSFYAKDCKPYTGRNPRTGESVEVKAKKLPCFRQGKDIKDFFKSAQRKP